MFSGLEQDLPSLSLAQQNIFMAMAKILQMHVMGKTRERASSYVAGIPPDVILTYLLPKSLKKTNAAERRASCPNRKHCPSL